MFYTFLKNAAAESLLGHSLELMAREIGEMPESGGIRAVALGGGYGRLRKEHSTMTLISL